MNAIELLKSQHEEVEELFEQLDEADEADEKQDLFNQVADALAIHARIEETYFYPAVRARRTEDILLESLEEHTAMKRVIADCLKITSTDETFDAKCQVLMELVEHHVEEEESDLFPKSKKALNKEELEMLGQEMLAMTTELEGTDPRFEVPKETAAAPPL